MNYLVDTSAYSWAARGHRDIVECMRSAERLYLTPVVRAELLNGFSLGSKKSKNLEQFASFCRSRRVKMLPVVDTTSDYYSLIWLSLKCKGQPIPTNDVWIAASAMQHGLTVLTTDAHFSLITEIRVCWIDVSKVDRVNE